MEEKDPNKLPVQQEGTPPAVLEEKTITIPEQQLIALLDRIKSYEEKEDTIAACCVQALTVIGLIDKTTGQPIPGLKNGDNVMGIVIDHLRENISFSEFLFNKKKATEKLAADFAFLKDLIYIFEDYARRKQSV